MKRNVISVIERLVGALIVLVMFMTNTSAFATDIKPNTFHSEMLMTEMEYGTSVTYNVDTKELTYGEDQNGIEHTTRTTQISQENDEVLPASIVVGNRRKVTNTTDSPYRNICFVEVTFPDGSTGSASGTLVYFNVLLTAGHVVYDKDHGGWATSLQVTPGKNGSNSRPLGTAKSTRLTTNNAWINNQDFDWDWAIVDLDTNFSTWQLFAYYGNYNSQVNTSVTAIGYPREDKYCMYYSDGSVKSAGEHYININCDATKGQSGGAIIDKASGYLVGIISNEHSNYNTGVRLNEDLCNRISSHQK